MKTFGTFKATARLMGETVSPGIKVAKRIPVK
jgi:hypothetical protein